MTLHQRIRAELEGKILSGEWPPGFRIPFEHELMAQYGCARMTVNKALAALVTGGLIERRRKAGSFVRRPPEASALLEIPDIKAQVTARGGHYGYRLMSAQRVRAGVDEQRRLGIAAETPMLALTCLHLADDLAFALEQRRIMLDAIPEAVDADFTTEPPGGWLLAHVPWHEAEHRISAIEADESIARLLALQPGTACLLLDRCTWRSGQLVTAVRLYYPGDRAELIARFTPSGQG